MWSPHVWQRIPTASAVGRRGCAATATYSSTDTNKSGPDKRSNRKPLFIGGIAVLAVLALAGLYLGALKRQAKPVSRRCHSGKINRRLAVRKPSEEKANAYFADGIQDEILTRLSKIADLKVISRTSTQHYKSAPENLPRSPGNLRSSRFGRQRAKERRRCARKRAANQSSQ